MRRSACARLDWRPTRICSSAMAACPTAYAWRSMMRRRAPGFHIQHCIATWATTDMLLQLAPPSLAEGAGEQCLLLFPNSWLCCLSRLSQVIPALHERVLAVGRYKKDRDTGGCAARLPSQRPSCHSVTQCPVLSSERCIEAGVLARHGRALGASAQYFGCSLFAFTGRPAVTHTLACFSHACFC